MAKLASNVEKNPTKPLNESRSKGLGVRPARQRLEELRGSFEDPSRAGRWDGGGHALTSKVVKANDWVGKSNGRVVKATNGS